jgi:hypothetical protein
MMHLQENLKTYIRLLARKAGTLDPANIGGYVSKELSKVDRFRCVQREQDGCVCVAVYKQKSLLHRPVITLVLLTEPVAVLPVIQGLGLYLVLHHNFHAFRAALKNKKTPIFPLGNPSQTKARELLASLTSLTDLIQDSPDKLFRQVSMAVTRYTRRYNSQGGSAWVPCSSHGLSSTSKNPALLRNVVKGLQALSQDVQATWAVYSTSSRVLDIQIGPHHFFYLFIPDKNSIQDLHIHMANSLALKGRVVVITNSEPRMESMEEFRKDVATAFYSPDFLAEESIMYPISLSVLQPVDITTRELPSHTKGPDHLPLAAQYLDDYLAGLGGPEPQGHIQIQFDDDSL